MKAPTLSIAEWLKLQTYTTQVKTNTFDYQSQTMQLKLNVSTSFLFKQAY